MQLGRAHAHQSPEGNEDRKTFAVVWKWKLSWIVRPVAAAHFGGGRPLDGILTALLSLAGRMRPDRPTDRMPSAVMAINCPHGVIYLAFYCCSFFFSSLSYCGGEMFTQQVAEAGVFKILTEINLQSVLICAERHAKFGVQKWVLISPERKSSNKFEQWVTVTSVITGGCT